MLFGQSLRLRLIVLVLTPLLFVALGGLGWQYRQASQSAAAIYDQKLSIIALAIFRDLLATNGERLSPATKLLFEEASGAPFFYHVSGPDGSFVTGYSPPPVPTGKRATANELVFFQSSHRGRPVTVVQLMERAEIDQLSGVVMVSVWQDLEQRRAFAQAFLLRDTIIAGLLLLTTAMVVFFGVRRGLRPLRALEEALIRRSSSDLGPIRRQVPVEVRQIVRRLNDLFAEVTNNQAEKDRFISNAAHQLRNPIASIHSLAEVTQSSRSLADAHERNAQLLTASSHLVRLTQQLLSYEALRHSDMATQDVVIDEIIEAVATKHANAVIEANLDFAYEPGCDGITISADPVLIEQAVTNLLDNALTHGGDEISQIVIKTKPAAHHIEIIVSNDGKPVPSDLTTRIFDRFEQGYESAGSGLGLAIVREICARHNGTVTVTTDTGNTGKTGKGKTGKTGKNWTSFTIKLPTKAPASKAE